MKKSLSLENLIYLVIFLLPGYLMRIKMGIFSTNVFEILVFVIFIFWLFGKNKKEASYKFYSDYKRYIFCGALIFFGFLFSALVNGNYGEGFGIIKSWLLVPIAFTLLAAGNVAKEKLKNIFLAYYLSALAVAMAALGYFFLGFLTFDGRLQVIFNSPNYLAMYIAPALIAMLVRSQKINEKFKVIFFIISFLIILFVFYKTYSYAAWAAVLISVSLVYIIQKRMPFKKILAISGIIAALIFLQLKNDKLESLINLNQRSSLASREMIWRSAGNMLENNWILGIGPGNFQAMYLSYQKYFPPYLEWAVPHPHNLYLAFWLYGGILGILGFLGLLFFFFRDIFKKIKNSREIKKDTKGCFVSPDVLFMSLGIMLYILLHGIFDTTYFKNDLAVVFWLCFLAIRKTKD